MTSTPNRTWTDRLLGRPPKRGPKVYVSTDRRDGPTSNTPRRLREADLLDFEQAATERPPINPINPTWKTNHTMTELKKFHTNMKRIYPGRMNRLQRDVNWLMKKARKVGIDPDDVRRML